MLFTTETINKQDLDNIKNFFDNLDKEFEAVSTVEEDCSKETPVTQYISTLVCGQYQKAVEDIENTKIGNKIVRKRNLQQIMKESFFYGSNRFGNNFIA